MPTGLTWTVVWNRPGPVTQRLHDRVDMELFNALGQMLSLAQGRVNVLTGETRDSGEIIKLGTAQYQLSFGGAALWLEFGTSHAPPYPFLLQSVWDSIPGLNARLAMTTQGRVTAGLLGTGIISTPSENA